MGIQQAGFEGFPIGDFFSSGESDVPLCGEEYENGLGGPSAD